MPAAAKAELWRTIKALAAMNLGQNAVAVTPSLRVLVRYKQGDREVTDAAVIAVVEFRDRPGQALGPGPNALMALGVAGCGSAE